MFLKNLRWTPVIEFLKHRLTFGRSQMFLIFPLQPDALKYILECVRLFQRIRERWQFLSLSELLFPKTYLGTLKSFCVFFKNPPCSLRWTVWFSINLLKSKTLEILCHWERATLKGFQLFDPITHKLVNDQSEVNKLKTTLCFSIVHPSGET